MNNRSRSMALVLAAALLSGVPIGIQAQAPPLIPPPPPPPPGAPGAPEIVVPPVRVAPNTPDGGATVPAPNTALPPATPNPAAPAAGSVTLRYKFRTGQVLSYRLSLDTDGTVTNPSGTGIPIKQHMDMSLHQTVKSVSPTDGSATMLTQVDALTMTLNGQNIQLPAQVQQQMRQAITTTMTPTGKVIGFKTPTGATGMVPGLSFNPMDMQNLRALPDGPIAAGGTWNSKFEAPSGILNAYSKYTLSDVTNTDGRAVAAIGQKHYAEIKPSKTAAPSASGPKITGLITGTGTEQFDVDAGVLNSQTNALQLKMTIAPPNSGKTGGIKANFQINSKLTRVGADSVPATAVPAPNAPASEPPTGQLQ